MSTIEGIKVLLREKSGKKLAVLSAAVFLFVTLIAFIAVFQICGNSYLRQMDEHLARISDIVESRNDEMMMRKSVYEEDAQIREELGLKLYNNKNAITGGEDQESYSELVDWSDVLEHMIAGEDAAAYARTGDEVAAWPETALTPGKSSQLNDELTEIFKNSDGGRVVTLLGKHYVASVMHYPQENTDILLTVPVKAVFRNGFFIALSIAAALGWGIMLMQMYILRRLLREKRRKGSFEVSRRELCRLTWPGIAAVLAVTTVFSSMLLMLENSTNSSFIAMSQRESIQYEIDWHKDQERTIRSSYTELYRTRAQILADYLAEHPDMQTRAGLRELSSIAKTDYLMLFDSSGQEIVSSNSYRGFSADKNLSEEYQAVMMGYPYAVAGPAADPYSGKMQLGTAILMTDSEGEPNGFLLAVYSAGDLNAELKRMSYENTINSFTVQEGHVAAAVNDEDGCYIAHTDPEMIGQKAGDSLEEPEPGSSFEGFTEYKGESVCLSAVSADGRTLISIVPGHEDSYVQAKSLLLGLIVLLILAALYYPAAAVYIAQAMDETEEKLRAPARERSPLAVLSDGYVVFLTLFAIFAMIASANGWWTSFDYVFSGRWSKGVNLFSVWAALFIVVVTLCCELIFRTVLLLLESRISLRARTVTRLANSIIVYAACIFLVFYVSDIFGMNTTAMLASAGVISIAIGMGAQTMAADLLAGFFMILEGAIHVGDYVSVGNVKGHVTDMGIRTTEITDDEGNVVILSNSKVSPVCNMSHNHAKPKKPEDKSADAAKDGIKDSTKDKK